MAEEPESFTKTICAPTEQDDDPFAYRRDRPPLPQHSQPFGILAKKRGESLGDE